MQSVRKSFTDNCKCCRVLAQAWHALPVRFHMMYVWSAVESTYAVTQASGLTSPTAAKCCYNSRTTKNTAKTCLLQERQQCSITFLYIHPCTVLLHLAAEGHVQACHQPAHSSAHLARHASLMCRAAHIHHWASDMNTRLSV